MISALDAMRWAGFATKRDRKGSDWCLRKGIGRDRKAVEKAAGVLPFKKLEPRDGVMDRARAAAVEALGEICLDCPLTCILARR